MSNLKTVYLFVLVIPIIYNSAQTCNTVDRFKHKWFGSNCQYKCHCKNDVACNVTNGDCPSGCDIGWFGPACQYADIAKNATLSVNSNTSQGVTYITDGDDTTCAKLTGTNLSLDVTWNFGFYFTWLRIVARNIEEPYKENLSIKFPDNVTIQKECVFIVDNITMDIYCNLSKVTDKIFLNGNLLTNLCSLYVSQGRNVALKQPTNQTSTQNNHVNYLPSNAVDGNPSWNDNSCTHTSESSDPAPRWTVVLNHSVTVQAYTIYNRVGTGDSKYCCLVRLQGFILTTFDQRTQRNQNYTDSLKSPQEVYYVLPSDPLALISKVQIEATYQDNNVFKTKVLTLCEVEIFGDSICPNNTYGRDCENVCNCDVPGENCFVNTGNCPSGCKAGYYGQGCAKPCGDGYFGIDCKNKCCNCLNQQCDKADGECNSCALPGKKLPYCIQDCVPGFYGLNCNSSCPDTCSQTGSICDVSNGDCIRCKSGFYGSDCLMPCSKNCKDDNCNMNSGNCTSCKPGYQGSLCNEECSNNTYGEDCFYNCSSNCKIVSTDARICHNDNGYCKSGCKDGFE